ncbi:MAG: bifunctional proline dehydrogenase/L-glutamate gamma-semialdehyde dehydrogenase [Acidimicrobiales bacterium]
MTMTLQRNDADELTDDAVALVETWLRRAREIETANDRATSGQLHELIEDPNGVAFTMAFVDRVARPDDDRAAADQLASLVAEGELPAFLSRVDRLLLQAGARLAPRLPAIVMPLARRRMRMIVGHLVADARPERLAAHLAERQAAGYALNVNLLGEAVLGEAEADRRLERTKALLDQPDVDYVSVKVSAVASQLNPWAYDEGVERVADRLRELFRRAAASDPVTFVNLDMEEYHDLELTIDVFTRLLDEPEFQALDAGIVLQAYLPDALGALQHLVAWSDRRAANGGASIKIRLVKGANLAMEKVDAAMHGWEQTPYDIKADTDANYKRCLDWVLRPEHLGSVRIGVASHNLFDVAWARLVSTRRGVAERVEFEMLQGMAPAQARVVRDDAAGLLLYTPAVAPADFDVAISYLFRRLEENAAPDNFLRVLGTLAPGTVEFARSAQGFREAVARRWDIELGPRRQQDRLLPPAPWPADRGFENEPDTDPALPANRAWAAAAVAAPFIPVQTPITTTIAGVDEVLERLRAGQPAWAAIEPAHRRATLYRIADELSKRRAELLGAMVHEGRKTIAEADPEISEGIDFARWYGDACLDLASDQWTDDGALCFEPMGVIAVVPPWNFPMAIPAGGVLAALAAGNTVAFKPAPETPRVAEIVAEACWAAGVPKDALAFIRIPDDEVGRRLVISADGVILTGSLETARLFRSWKPDISLFAETSGKNALVVTPHADIDLAVADLVRSAFGHSGQKCSAASLGILVGEVYESPRFRRQLIDAVQSLEVGMPTDLATTTGPLILPAEGKLLRAFEQLDDGEEWLVEPRQLDASGSLWSPGVRIGVRPGSWFHQTECFGPVLGLMSADTLDEAIELQNTTDFGLTGGIHTLEPREVDHWLERVEIGNAYVNRHITGAIVRRQPFGGWKRSSIGPGAKAGGPNYVMQFGQWVDERPRNQRWLDDARRSDDRWWHETFDREHDPSGLFCESNVFRYRSRGPVGLRIGEDADTFELQRIREAAARCGVTLVESLSSTESAEEAVQRFCALGCERLRVVGGREHDLVTAAAAVDMDVLHAPVVGNGRVELLHYLREQAVSRTLHRFGNLVANS